MTSLHATPSLDSAPESSIPVGAPDWLVNAWRQQAEVRSVDVEGAAVRYRAWGLADADKPGLILVHGFRAHARWWDHIAPFFTDRFRVVAPDLSGMGDSDWRPGYSRRQMGRELLAVIDDAGLDKAHLVTHSFGSVVGLHCAAMNPDRFARVVVIDAFVFRPEDEPNIPDPSQKYYPAREAALARFRLLPEGKCPDPFIKSYIGENSIKLTDKGWTWKFDAVAPESLFPEQIRHEIRGMSVPADFIYGGLSEVVGPDEARSFVENVANCGVPVMIPNSDHHIMIEQPLALVAALNGLFANPRQNT